MLNSTATVVLLAAWSAAVQASEVVLGAYVRLPLDQAAPEFGIAAVPDFQLAPGRALFGPGDGRTAGLHLRLGGARGPSLSLNGVPLRRLPMLYQDAGTPSADHQEVDWHLVAGVVLGAGLIYAIADADEVRVSGCSGTNCPPEGKPPTEPDPDEPDGETPDP
jgi:hypothetical protein